MPPGGGRISRIEVSACRAAGSATVRRVRGSSLQGRPVAPGSERVNLTEFRNALGLAKPGQFVLPGTGLGALRDDLAAGTGAARTRDEQRLQGHLDILPRLKAGDSSYYANWSSR